MDKNKIIMYVIVGGLIMYALYLIKGLFTNRTDTNDESNALKIIESPLFSNPKGYLLEAYSKYNKSKKLSYNDWLFGVVLKINPLKWANGSYNMTALSKYENKAIDALNAIKKAKGFYGDNEPAVLSVYQSMANKLEIANFNEWASRAHNFNVLSYIQSMFNDSQLANLNRIVNSKKDY